MIVKPSKGWSSECVSKVNSVDDLVVAVQKATGRHGGSAVVEPFFDGPEIDVNFVLLDGQVLFCEIADEQPSEADACDATVNDTFSAEGLTLPSALPHGEQELAKSTLHKILVDLGFRTGVFHVEGRMVNSRYEYRKLDAGLTDLVPKPAHRMPKQEPSCRLLEINARPPAYRVTLSTRHTYGVDFFAAHILASIGERERLALAAVPFDFGPAASSRAQNSQCWSRLIYISAPTEGIAKSEAPCEELKKRRPDLAKHVVLSNDYHKKGDKVALFTSGARTCVGHVLVGSGTSRREAIEIGEQIRRDFVFEVEDSARPKDG
ncbi:ATP-grasp domain-containing protein [Hirsutella rhossiliensis]|uniref:ATP-grasp domain-containing protein n=1 Tax=Hirsutella rhossiliensis TaxID=111463 RepID=A0A9P8MTW6_9HYPO|nr:ATP-grasp domain-containing protein [Hirsutella rhossiliensis]KAH0960997.1 ATP-grasp domain-containing protein [Hirsutella rhossiliensis]